MGEWVVPNVRFFRQLSPNLGETRSMDWACLAHGIFGLDNPVEYAMMCADVAYLAGVNPHSKEFYEMTERLAKTFFENPQENLPEEAEENPIGY